MSPTASWEVEFYPPWPAARQPAAKDLRSLEKRVRARVINKIEMLREHGPYVLLEDRTVTKLEDALYELRQLGRPSYRILFTCYGQRIIILLIAPKKGRKLPKATITTARRRARKSLQYLKEQEA